MSAIIRTIAPMNLGSSLRKMEIRAKEFLVKFEEYGFVQTRFRHPSHWIVALFSVHGIGK
jgi:hypothetical protein